MLSLSSKQSSTSINQEILELEEKYNIALIADVEFEELKRIKQAINLLKAQLLNSSDFKEELQKAGTRNKLEESEGKHVEL